MSDDQDSSGDDEDLGAAGHLSAEQLDELATQASADIDPGDVTAGGSPNDPLLDRHLAGCARCRTALGDQVAVQAWLRRIPDPGPMPVDVTTRLDAALAGARSTRPAPGNVLPMHQPDRRSGRLGRLAESRVTKSLVAAAAVVLIASGGYAAIHRSSADTSTASGSSAASSPGSKAAAGAAGGSADSAAVTVRESGTPYTKDNVVSQVVRQLTATTPAPAFESQAGKTPTTLSTPAGLAACLKVLQVPGVTPLLVDLATFDGKPVAVIVLPGDAQGRQVWVVSRTCSATDDSVVYYVAFH